MKAMVAMRALAFALVFALPMHALALEPGEALPDAAAEARARSLFVELRCMVCQNQSISDSDAPLAKDLRMLVRERVSAGDSSEEIKEFLVERYGEFVLLRPRFSGETALLWLAPGIVLVGGAVGMLLARRRRLHQQPQLSDDEERRLEALLDKMR
ncbi:cytochrome c-type biogenesis protein [Terrihabitans rhizophilus]|uniref:Cytochrome c-type biogenesis protein n=1 Tax=Terrihabitans rhizophilus TaxID=3092662 RepID=A0ABU4RUP5_9HYPH|nr:cytochrome c-type biogenesis protein [Terrihabitans sp. PJ23]MDX6806581.1 cytochrome c-type biogenesis protein [Terrihabitans sp. PJ23]